MGGPVSEVVCVFSGSRGEEMRGFVPVVPAGVKQVVSERTLAMHVE